MLTQQSLKFGISKILYDIERAVKREESEWAFRKSRGYIKNHHPYIDVDTTKFEVTIIEFISCSRYLLNKII